MPHREQNRVLQCSPAELILRTAEKWREGSHCGNAAIRLGGWHFWHWKVIFLEFSSDGSDEVSADWVRPKKEKNKHKWKKKKKRAQHPWYLMLIAVAKDCLWKAWGKWQYCIFFPCCCSETANIKNKKNLSDWSEKTVKCQAVIKHQTCFLLKRYQQKEKPNLSASEWKSLIPSCAALHTSKTLALYKAYTFPSDSNL